METRVGRYFTYEQAQKVSKRRLSEEERLKFGRHVRIGGLDAATEVWGPFYVTSFVRDSGAHADGSAVDIQPVSGDETRIRAIADWFASMFQPPAGYWQQIIYEAPEAGQRRGHIHLTIRLPAGAAPGYLQDRQGTGKYSPVSWPPTPTGPELSPPPAIVWNPHPTRPEAPSPVLGLAVAGAALLILLGLPRARGA